MRLSNKYGLLLCKQHFTIKYWSFHLKTQNDHNILY